MMNSQDIDRKVKESDHNMQVMHNPVKVWMQNNQYNALNATRS